MNKKSYLSRVRLPRTRQGSITQEITEIIGGAAAVQNRAE